jgi:hypothetical protein
MAWFLFIDESGQDHRESPYEVLAGVAIRDEELWNLIRQLHDSEVAHFGRRYSEGARELKAKMILKRKTFHHAALNTHILPFEYPQLAKACLDDGANNNTVRHFKALALAKLGYVTDVLSMCKSRDCRVFASVVEADAPTTTGHGLRKDYAYLFERFFYFLEDERQDAINRSMEFWFLMNSRNPRAISSSTKLIGISRRRQSAGKERILLFRNPSSFIVT